MIFGPYRMSGNVHRSVFPRLNRNHEKSRHFKGFSNLAQALDLHQSNMLKARLLVKTRFSAALLRPKTALIMPAALEL